MCQYSGTHKGIVRPRYEDTLGGVGAAEAAVPDSQDWPATKP